MKDIAIKLVHPMLHWLNELMSSYISSKFNVCVRGLSTKNDYPFQRNDAEMLLNQTPQYNPCNNTLVLKFTVKVNFKYDCDKVTLFMHPVELYGSKVTAREFECDYKIVPEKEVPYYKAGHWYIFRIEYSLKNDDNLCKEPSDG